MWRSRDHALRANGRALATCAVAQCPFSGGRIIAQGSWQLVGTQDIGGIAFNEWHADSAVLLVNPTIDFDPL
jgi:hypothetical protein